MYTNKINIGRIAYWSPWSGCSKVSEGCLNCFIKKFSFNLKDNKIPKGYDIVAICLETDFFLEEADNYRPDIWKKIKEENTKFLIVTKRPERIKDCLPEDWGEGYNNVIIAVTCENQKRVDERLKILKEIPCKHKWVTVSPMLENIDISSYLKDGFIEAVECTGEKFKNARECKFEWVKNLSDQCKTYNTTFYFMSCGYNFTKDNIKYFDSKECYHSPMADYFKLSYKKS